MRSDGSGNATILVAQASPQASTRASSPRPASPCPATDSGTRDTFGSDLLSFSRIARTLRTNFFAKNNPDFKFKGAGEAVFGSASSDAGSGGAAVKDSAASGHDHLDEVTLFRVKATGFR